MDFNLVQLNFSDVKDLKDPLPHPKVVVQNLEEPQNDAVPDEYKLNPTFAKSKTVGFSQLPEKAADESDQHLNHMQFTESD